MLYLIYKTAFGGRMNVCKWYESLERYIFKRKNDYLFGEIPTDMQLAVITHTVSQHGGSIELFVSNSFSSCMYFMLVMPVHSWRSTLEASLLLSYYLNYLQLYLKTIMKKEIWFWNILELSSDHCFQLT